MENSERNISSHDSAVLARIFSPNLPYGDLHDEESQQQNVTGNDIQRRQNYKTLLSGEVGKSNKVRTKVKDRIFVHFTLTVVILTHENYSPKDNTW